MGWVLGASSGLAAWSVWRDRLPRLRMWLLFFIGLAAAGMLGSMDAKIAHWLTQAGNGISHKVLGVTAGVVFVAVMVACEFWDRASPRNGGGGHRWGHSIMALIAPEVFIAAGGIFATVMGLGTGLLVSVPQTLNGLL